jgi:hypothetical protein
LDWVFRVALIGKGHLPFGFPSLPALVSPKPLFRFYPANLGCERELELAAGDQRRMPKVALNTPAPDFALETFQGETVRLSDFKGKANVLLVFNRGFT